MSHGKPFIRLRSRVTTLPLAAYVSHAGFSLLQCPAAQAMLATLGFSLRHFHAFAAAAAWYKPRATDRPPVFPCMEFTGTQPAAKYIAGVCLCTPVSAGFFSFIEKWTRFLCCDRLNESFWAVACNVELHVLFHQSILYTFALQPILGIKCDCFDSVIWINECVDVNFQVIHSGRCFITAGGTSIRTLE